MAFVIDEAAAGEECKLPVHLDPFPLAGADGTSRRVPLFRILIRTKARPLGI